MTSAITANKPRAPAARPSWLRSGLAARPPRRSSTSVSQTSASASSSRTSDRSSGARRRSRGGALRLRAGTEGGRGEIGVVDGAGEDDDRSRRLAPLAGADLFEQAAQLLEGLVEAGPVIEIDRPAKPLAAPCRQPAPSDVANPLAPGLQVMEAG